jgi:hypothetical protein
MHSERVKEALDHDDGARTHRYDPVEIEEHQRLAETGREAIFRFLPVDGAPGVRDQPTGRVVDGNDDPTAQKAAAPIRADAKRADRLCGQSSCREIRVTPIDVL